MLSDSFEVDLRAALQVQADLLRRIERTTEGAARDFAESRIAPGEIGAADAALAELEAHAELLDAGDLEDFDPDEIPRIYERRRAAVSSELVRIGYRGWDHFVGQTRTFALTHGLLRRRVDGIPRATRPRQFGEAALDHRHPLPLRARQGDRRRGRVPKRPPLHENGVVAHYFMGSWPQFINE